MKKNKSVGKDKVLPYVVIVGIVAIVAIVSLFLWNGIEGASVIYSYVDENQAVCLDNDPTNDHYKAGVVHYGKIKYYDYCLNDLLYQPYCLSVVKPRLSSPGFKCPKGCLNGACIK